MAITADYFVDLGTTAAWDTRAGTATTTCWYGTSGLQNVLDTAAVGKVVALKGTGDLSKHYTVPYDANSGNLSNGEQVSWDHGEGAWADGTDTGIVQFTGAMATPVVIELIGASVAPSDNDVIKGATSGNTITAAAGAAVCTLDINTQSGTNAGGYIKYRGCDSSWDVTGERAKVNVNGAAVMGITVAASMHLLWLENIEVYGTSAGNYDGISFGGACNGWVVINCSFHNCGRHGVNGTSSRPSVSLWHRCTFYSNAQCGFNVPGTGWFMFCSFHNNSTHGMFSTTAVTSLIGCLFYANTQDGINSLSAGTLLYQCVVDGNQYDGVNVTTPSSFTYPTVLIGNRITNQDEIGKQGLDCNSEPTVTGYNYFENNTGDENIVNYSLHYSIPGVGIATTSNVNETIDAVTEASNQGYVNPATPDYNLSTTAQYLRRTAITVPIA